MEPIIKLDPNGRATLVQYNTPEPTSYWGRNLIELDFGDDYFLAKYRQPPGPTVRTPPASMEVTAVRSSVVMAMRTGFADAKLFPNVRVSSMRLRFSGDERPEVDEAVTRSVSTKLATLDPDEVTANLQQGRRLNVYRSLYGTLTYNYVPEPVTPRPRLYIVETYQMSSFLGSYGAGRTVHALTLVPGEKTRISVKTYTKRETDAKSASSVLDSFTQESADDFEESVQSEQSDRAAYSKSFEYHAEAEASASWGFGSAKVSGGVKGSTSSAREEFAKNVSSATRKHAAKASAKRDVQVNTSYEVKEQTGEETSIEREIQNINLSRTLNFIFRQMNQEFITLLHLTDVRIGFFNGYAETRREVSLRDLDSLLTDVMIEDAAKRAQVKQAILDELLNVFDYNDERAELVEENTLTDREGDPIPNSTYWRVKRQVSTYTDPISATKVDVPGVIVGVTRSTLRTEGVIVETMMGGGDALDAYAQQLQQIEASRKAAEASLAAARAAREELLNQIVRDRDASAAKLLQDLTCPCGPTPSPT